MTERNHLGRFKKGSHWREPKPYWAKDWLEREYLELKKPAVQIADEQGCRENNILYFLSKHGIPRRTMKETRAIKSWCQIGEANGMFGRTGAQNPNWRGGITAERQSFYSSQEWGQAVQEVWSRDTGLCQRCDAFSGHALREFHIHHIISFQVVELRAAVDNLVLLCAACHSFVHSKRNTERAFLLDEFIS